MKMMSATKFKRHFSDVIDQVRAGETIAVTYGRRKEIIGYFSRELPNKPKRRLGILEGKAKAIFAPDFKMTEEEFLGLAD